MFGTGRVYNKVFSPKIFLDIYKMVANMKLTFTSVPFRHNSASISQQWLKLKRFMTVRLAHVLYFLMDIK